MIHLPQELRELILHHACAMKIQKAVRIYAFRHAKDLNWKFLRKRLIIELNYIEIDVLTKSSLVRKEWRTEPSSWIYMLMHSPSTIAVLVQESKDGMWN